MEIRTVLRALRTTWWLVAASVVLGIAAALALTSSVTPQYRSTSELFVSTIDSSSTAEALAGSRLSANRIVSYAQLLAGEELAGRVVDALGLSMTPVQLADQVSVAPVPDTVLLEFTVTDPDPARAQSIAREVGQQLIGLVQELESSSGDPAPVRVTVAQPPDLPSSPSLPRINRSLLVGSVLGFVTGVGGVIIRMQLDRTVRDPETVAELVGAPSIGVIPRDPLLKGKHLFNRTTNSPAAEGYRRLRTNLQFLDVDRPPKTIMVSSAIPGEGKTALTVSLALTLAEVGRKVAVVEADLRRPGVVHCLGLISGVGLTNVLAGTAELDEVVQSCGDGPLSVIGAGPLPPNPGQLLASGQMASLVAGLAAKNDFVLIDAPPVLPVADATGLAVVVDGVILSVRYGSTNTNLLRRAAAALEQVGARTLGVVLNNVPVKPAVRAGSNYHYTYGGEP